MFNEQFVKKAGLALIIGALLLFVTMVLHPAGGSIEHLQEISTLIIVTHSIAILSVPFTLVGFGGLTYLLNHRQILTITAFTIVGMGLIAVMIAGILNGLALPLLVSGLSPSSDESTVYEMILRYNYSVNQAMTYVYIGANTLGIMAWSIRIIKTKPFTKWIGYYGLVLSIFGASLFLLRLITPDLNGFRLYIFGLVTWVVIIGFLMMNYKKGENANVRS